VENLIEEDKIFFRKSNQLEKELEIIRNRKEKQFDD
jgi:hypothetical protein